MSVKHKIEDIRKYYEYFQPTEIWLIKYSENPTIREISCFKDFYEAIISHNTPEKKCCVYTSINPHNGKRLTDNIKWVDKIFFDIDCYEDEKEVEEIIQELKKLNIRPEHHIKSGVGHYLFIPIPKIEVTTDNRNQVCNLVSSVIDYFNDRFKTLDGRCKDICRLSRVWGTLHYKNTVKKGSEPLLCQLLHTQSISTEDKKQNLKAISEIAQKRQQKYTMFSDTTVDECYACENIIENGFEEEIENTGFNDCMGKNISIYCFRKYGRKGLQLARKVYQERNKNPNEADGWLKKAEQNKDFKLNCFEIQNYLREFYSELNEENCQKCVRERKNRIVYTDEKLSIKELKQKYRKKYKFFIAQNQKLKGIIQPSDQGDAKKAYTIGWVVKKKQNNVYKKSISEINQEDLKDPYGGEYEFVYLGEKPVDMRRKVLKTETAYFYRYIFKEGDAEYNMLSEKKLDLEESIIQGMILELNDKILVGDKAAFLDTKSLLLFVHDYKTKQQKISTIDELFKLVDFSREDLLNMLFSHIDARGNLKTFVQPEFINTLILSWLFSGKLNYPLHINIVGPPSCGKTELLKRLEALFKEDVEDCGNSTIKGLIPSFYGKRPKLGALLSRRRVALLDELLNMIHRSSSGDTDLGTMFTTTNNILEHAKSSYSSGKTNLMGAKMKAKVWSVNNPLRAMTEEETINTMPPQFLDRFLMIRYTNNYKLYVNKLKGVKVLDEIKVKKNVLLSIFDFMQSFLSDFETERVMEITNKVRPLLPEYLLPFFDGRMISHHIHLVLDGIVKARCLISKDKSFNAIEDDYEVLEKWLKDYARWWWNDQLPKGLKVENFLTAEHKIILELIDTGIYRQVLAKKLEERNIEVKYNLKFLYDNNIIENDGNNKITRVNESEISMEDIKL